MCVQCVHACQKPVKKLLARHSLVDIFCCPVCTYVFVYVLLSAAADHRKATRPIHPRIADLAMTEEQANRWVNYTFILKTRYIITFIKVYNSQYHCIIFTLHCTLGFGVSKPSCCVPSIFLVQWSTQKLHNFDLSIQISIALD